MAWAPAPRLIAAFDASAGGRPEALAAVFAALDAAAAAPGLARAEARPEAPALGRRLRVAVHAAGNAGARIAPRPGGGLAAAGDLRLIDGPEGEAPGAALTRLARLSEGGAFDAETPVAPAEGGFALLVAEAAGAGERAPVRLTLLRDAHGDGRLFVARSPEGIVAAASHPLLLRALPFGPGEPDADRLALFLETLELPAAGTVWAGIEAVPPGGLLRLAPGAAPAARRWWRPGPDPALADLGDDDLVDALEARLRAATAGALRAAGPRLGAMVSGGLDSTMVVAALSAEAPGLEVPAFVSVSPSGVSPEEREPQAAVFRRFPGLIRHEVSSAGLDPEGGALPAWEAQALPCIDAVLFKNVALLAAAEAAGCDGVITGAGGDFVLSLNAESHLADALARGAFGEAAAVWAARRRMGTRVTSLLFRHVLQRLEPFAALAGGLRPADAPRLGRLHPRRAAARLGLGPRLPARRLAEELVEGLGPGRAWTAGDFALPRPGGAPAAAAPFTAPPFATPVLAAGMAAPARLGLHGGLTRGLARRLLERTGPPEVAWRPDKSPPEPDATRLQMRAARAFAPRLPEVVAESPMFRELVDLPLLERRIAALRAAPEDAAVPWALDGVLKAARLADFLDLAAGRGLRR